MSRQDKIIQKERLARKLNFVDCYFLVVGSVVGSGIFLTTGIMANELPSPIYIWITWLIGGLITIAGALTFAELGTMFPDAGGPYIYLREAFGSGAAFLYGWSFFWIVACGGIAALAVGFAEYFGSLVPGLPSSRVLLKFAVGPLDIRISAAQIFAVAAIVLLSALNMIGVKTGARFQNVTTGLRIAALLGFAAAGLILSRKSGFHQNLSAVFQAPQAFRWSGFGGALLAVIWTYDGWYSVSCAAEEVKKPEKTLPRALALGTLSVSLLYLLTNIVYSIALSMDEMKGVVRIGEKAASRLFGTEIVGIFSGVIALAIFGCLSANIMYCPRVYFAMARDRLFFKNLAFVHPRFRVPTKAVAVQMLWSSVLCLTGTYQKLYEFVVFALTLFFAATAISIVRLRRTFPDRARPYRVWGYPLLPVLYALINGAIFVNMVKTRPKQSAMAAILLCSGIPAFLFWRSKNRRRPSLDNPGAAA